MVSASTSASTASSAGRLRARVDPRHLVNRETDSMCGVCGNMSTGRRATRRVTVVGDERLGVPRERRRVAGDVDDPRRPRGRPTPASALPASPARGGSTTTRSGRPARSAELLEGRRRVAGEERSVRDPVQLSVLERAGDGLLRGVDAPDRQGRGPWRARSSRAAVEVVDRLLAGEPCVLDRER